MTQRHIPVITQNKYINMIVYSVDLVHYKDLKFSKNPFFIIIWDMN